MVDSQLRILIDALWRGRGATAQAAADVQGLGQASTSASGQMVTAAQRSDLLRAKAQELGDAVANGTMSMRDAENEMRAYGRSLGVVADSADAANVAVTASSRSFEDMLRTARNLSAGVVAAGAVFKKAFDLSEQGANIAQLRSSFDLLNETVLQTPALLEDMQAAARGTLTDAQIMQGVLKLAAGASNELARELAGASPQLLEIAKAAQKLNPQLGDTAFLYDSITTGIKRASPLILDNLGIIVKVGEANEKYAESLGKTVTQLTAEEKQIALLNGVLEAGGQIIEQVGGNVDSTADAWIRLRVQIQEATDAGKEWLALRLLPVVSSASGVYGDEFARIAEQQREAAESLQDWINIINQFQLGNFEVLGRVLTGTLHETNDAITKAAAGLAQNTSSFYAYQAILGTVGGQAGFVIETQGLMTEEFYNTARAAQDAKAALEGMSDVIAQTVGADRVLLQDYAGAVEEVTATIRDNHREIDRSIAAVGELRERIGDRDLEFRWQGIREAREELQNVQRLAGEGISIVAKIDVQEGQPQLFEAIKTITMGGFDGRTAEIPIDIIVNERGQQVGEPSLFERLLSGRSEALQQIVNYELRFQIAEADQLEEQRIRQQINDLTAPLLARPEPLEIPFSPIFDAAKLLEEADTGLRDVQSYIDSYPPLVTPEVDHGELDDLISFLQGDVTESIDGVFGAVHRLETTDNLPVLDSRLRETLSLVQRISGTHHINFVVTGGSAGSGSSGGAPPPSPSGGPTLHAPILNIPPPAASAGTVNLAPGAIVVNGVSDPRQAALEVVRHLEDRGIVARTRLR